MVVDNIKDSALSSAANKDQPVDDSPLPPLPPAVVHPDLVLVHPLVLLSVVDHYNRVAKDTKKRVVGILLGSWHGKTVDVANSYAVPFEEDENDPDIWFLDHNYHEAMWNMYRKVNAKEKVIGWYHSGPKLRPSDLAINEVIKRFTPNPVLVIVDVKPKEVGLPTDAYFAVEEIHDDGTQATKTFNHVATQMTAEEAEEIGVEHLLRDIKDNAVGSLATRVTNQLNSLKGLEMHLKDISTYLEKVQSGELPVNNQIMYNLQDIFNLLPNLNMQTLIDSFVVNQNDHFMVLYVAALIRSIIALHNLINNKIANRDAEKEMDGEKPKDKDADKDKEGDSSAKDKDKDTKDKEDSTSKKDKDKKQ